MTQQGAELWSGHTERDGLVADAKAAHVFLRQIDAVLGEVHAHILPEVGELQGRAGQVGEPEIFIDFVGGHFAAGIEHQAADGIGRVATVAQYLVHGGVTRDRLVLAEGDEQIGERLFGNVAGADGLGQRDKDRMTRPAFVAGVELAPPQIEKREGYGAVAYLVTQIVRDAAVGVD